MIREQLFEFPNAVKRDDSVKAWFDARKGELGDMARHWFDVIRACGSDVRELLHDYHPTACVGKVAFAYVNIFAAHVNVGFFQGTELPDPGGLLQGTGKYMRHVKLRPGVDIDDAKLTELIKQAYNDVKQR